MITRFKGRNEFLSNFYPVEVMVDGNIYPSVEHGYQAAKTLRPNERAIIQKAPSAADAKRLGREITLRKDWNEVKIDVMRKLLRAKFNKIGLRFMLLATGNEELVEENNWNDKFWGVCDGVGENWLGRLLMETRDFYRGNK